MSRPGPTHGVRVRIDFVLCFNEPVDTIPMPVGDTANTNALLDVIAKHFGGTVPTAARVDLAQVNVALDPRLSATKVAKSSKVKQ